MSNNMLLLYGGNLMKHTNKKIAAVFLAVMIMMLSCVTAFAAVSPTGSPSIEVVVIPTGGGTGTYEYETEVGKGPDGGTIVSFTPKPGDGYEFVEWEIEGNYKIISGSLKEGNLVIEAFGDIVATPYYQKDGATAATIITNGGKTAPQTGNDTFVIIAGIVVLLATAGVVIVKRKLEK